MEHPVKQQLVYEAEPHVVGILKTVREKIHVVCKQSIHKHVRVQTIDGHTFDGTILHFDAKHLYLSVHHNVYMQRQFFYPFYNPYAFGSFILPLALFDLLAISLLI